MRIHSTLNILQYPLIMYRIKLLKFFKYFYNEIVIWMIYPQPKNVKTPRKINSCSPLYLPLSFQPFLQMTWKLGSFYGEREKKSSKITDSEKQKSINFENIISRLIPPGHYSQLAKAQMYLSVPQVCGHTHTRIILYNDPLLF